MQLLERTEVDRNLLVLRTEFDVICRFLNAELDVVAVGYMQYSKFAYKYSTTNSLLEQRIHLEMTHLIS